MRYLIPLLLLIAGCELPTPAPSPSPSPAPSPVASASPSPEPSPSVEPSPAPSPSPSPLMAQISPNADRGSGFAGYVSVVMGQGETRGFWLNLDGFTCRQLPQASISNKLIVSFYRAQMVTTKTSSAIGLPVGDYPDALLPMDPATCGPGLYFVDVTVAKGSSPGTTLINLGGAQLLVRVSTFVMPDKPSFPLYIGMLGWSLLKAHGLTDDVLHQAAITKQYVDLYRQHRIEPMGQGITTYPPVNADGTLNLDLNQGVGGSFRQLVVDGAIAPPCMVSPIGVPAPSAAYLVGLEKAIKAGVLPPGTWSYTWDEGERDPAKTALALAREQFIAAGSPSVLQNLTREEDPQFAAAAIFTPVMEFFKRGGQTKPYWEYGSCMAQGKCENGPPVQPSGTPMMVFDAPSVHALAYLLVPYATGAKGALYYRGTEMVKTALTDQYEWGGNGDGTLVYLNGGVSARMKLLREASFMIEYLKAAGLTLALQIKDTRNWSRKYADYQLMRDGVAGGY